MTITISSENLRSIKAIEIAANSGQWLKCHTADGEKAYGIPSQREASHVYMVTSASCTCPDFERHGLSAARVGEAGYHGPCKHILAVRLVCELAKAQQLLPRRRQVAIASSTAALATRCESDEAFWRRFED